MIINICKFWPITTKFDFFISFLRLSLLHINSLLWNNQRQRPLMVEPHYLDIYVNRTRAILYGWLFAKCLLVCSKVYPLLLKSPKIIDPKTQVEKYWNIVETTLNNKIHSNCQISQFQPNLKIFTNPGLMHVTIINTFLQPPLHRGKTPSYWNIWTKKTSLCHPAVCWSEMWQENSFNNKIGFIKGLSRLINSA